LSDLPKAPPAFNYRVSVYLGGFRKGEKSIYSNTLIFGVKRLFHIEVSITCQSKFVALYELSSTIK
jgi:hypothetical protein